MATYTPKATGFSKSSSTTLAAGDLVTAGAFVVDQAYEIVTVGTTDFTAIGASANTVGVVFTATGAGSGTGTAQEAFSFTIGSELVVALAYDDAFGHPTSVKWGNRLLANRPPAATRDPGTYDIAMSVWVLPRVKRSTPHVIRATWSSAIVEKAMLVGQIDGKNRIDVAAGNNDGVSTGNPVTGTTAALANASTLAMAFFAAEGPDTNDTPGTMQIKDNNVFTNVTGTQRTGTNGAPPLSNVTMNAGWLQLTSATATQGQITGATARLWTSCVVTFTEANDLRQGVTPTDAFSVEEIFEDHTPALDPEDAAYVYSLADDRYEAFDKNDMATRIAYWTPTGWTAG